MSTASRNRILVIAGPTASGKSSLAIEIARKHGGEVVSVDSRQVYRGMDIGTGKVTAGEQALARHWLLDVADPNENYNVTDFQRDAEAAIQDIRSRNRLPIVCGGTGFWIQALVEGQRFPEVKPDLKLREELSTRTREELFEILRSLDPERAGTIDRKNPVRLIRAIEIAVGRIRNQESGIRQNPEPAPKKPDSLFLIPDSFLIIALAPSMEVLREKIRKRLDERFAQGMAEEVARLHREGVDWERLESFGLEYKWIAYRLQGKVSEKEMKERLYFDSVHYAKRQLTWLRRWERQGARIRWIDMPEKAFDLIG
jgi:tRNA dimethylallyltransferase